MLQHIDIYCSGDRDINYHASPHAALVDRSAFENCGPASKNIKISYHVKERHGAMIKSSFTHLI